MAAIPFSMAYFGWFKGIAAARPKAPRALKAQLFLLITLASYYSGRLLIQLQKPGQAGKIRVRDV